MHIPSRTPTRTVQYCLIITSLLGSMACSDQQQGAVSTSGTVIKQVDSTEPTSSSTSTCSNSSPLTSARGTNAKSGTPTDTPQAVLISELGDFSHASYLIGVVYQSDDVVNWTVRIEDPRINDINGEITARKASDGTWYIEMAEWCRVNDSPAEVALTEPTRREQPYPSAPSSFAACPMSSDRQIELVEGGGLSTSGQVLGIDLSSLPVSDYSIIVADKREDLVRWDITITEGPWGLTFGRKIARKAPWGAWNLHTSEWCHMEPSRFS